MIAAGISPPAFAVGVLMSKCQCTVNTGTGTVDANAASLRRALRTVWAGEESQSSVSAVISMQWT